MSKKLKRINIILNYIDEDNIPKATVNNDIMLKIRYILSFIIILYLCLIYKTIELGADPKMTPEMIISNSKIRGSIFDKHGHVLAINLPTKSIYIKPDEIANLDTTLKKIIDLIFQVKDRNKAMLNLQNKVTSSKKFVWIQRHLLPSVYSKLKLLGLPGVYLIDDSKRFYPHENEVSHIIGFVDIDQNGISGVERAFNDQLSNGEDIHLSLDVRVQSAVRHSLNKAITEHEAIGGLAVVMNVRNGEIISIVSAPDFNPNIKKNLSDDTIFNRVTLGVYEMGSTFKILTLAIGLDTGVVKYSDVFDVSQPIKLGKYQIGDYRFHKARLSLPEVLIFSSNRGVGQIGMKIGIAKQQEYFRNLGMLSPITLEISEKGKPIYINPKQWNDIYLITMSYGHGIAVTSIHAAQAIAAVVNGGILYKPTLLKTVDHPAGTRIFHEKTSQTMRKIMRLVVEEGYGKKAEVIGYNIGGKTGTAEKVKNGRYIKNNCNLVSFVGAFPIDDPQYVMFVAIDEPKQNKANFGFTTGGMIAAPLAADILRSAGHLLQN